MTFTSEEKEKLKTMMKFLVKRKNLESGNHNGFHLFELRPILDEMVEDGTIIERPTIHRTNYFINN